MISRLHLLNKRNTKFILVFLFILTITIFPFAGSLSAATITTTITPLNLLVSPYEEVISVSPGDTRTVEFSIRNNGTENENILLSFEDFKAPDDNSGTPQYFLGSGSNSFIFYPHSWFSQPGIITIPPSSYKNVDVELKIPPNASPGGHYGGVIFESVNSQNQNSKETGIHITGKVAVPVLITVSGQLHEAMNIHSFHLKNSVAHVLGWFGNAMHCFWMNNCTDDAQVLFQNTGNEHESPQGVIEVYNLFGSRVDVINFNASHSYVLPESTRMYTTHIRLAKYGGFYFGPLQTKITVAYGSAQTQLSATDTVFVINWTIILLVLIVLLTTTGWYVYKKTHRKIHNRVI